MKTAIPPSSHPAIASVKPDGRDGITAGGHRASGPFIPMREPGGARLPLAIERAANSPQHARLNGDMYQDPDIESELEKLPWGILAILLLWAVTMLMALSYFLWRGI